MTFDARHSVNQGLHPPRPTPRPDHRGQAEAEPERTSLGRPSSPNWTGCAAGRRSLTSPPTCSRSSRSSPSDSRTLGFPFDDHTRLVSTLGNELRIVRNRWAHHDELTALDAWRAHDFTVRLLEHFGDAQGVASAGSTLLVLDPEAEYPEAWSAEIAPLRPYVVPTPGYRED